LRLHCPEITNVQEEVIDLLRQVGIPEPAERAKQYPHELSGGMQQRVMIAMALASRPSILIADEPTTALDVTIQAQILELLDQLRRTRKMSVILVTHNLGIVSELADRVAVMYAGRIVEVGDIFEVFYRTGHPYARALITTAPSLLDRGEDKEPIQGVPPDLIDLPSGCAFHPRCPYATDLCRCQVPELKVIGA
jgi:oligopeptide/dipeptide ABC transporter ATP-binding protein